MEPVRIGVLGGTGVYELSALHDVEEIELDTPFGPPSDSYILGTLDGQRVAFLSRHGRGHRISPTQLKTTIGVRICWQCRARELALDLSLFVGCLFLFPALLVPAMKVGDWLGSGVGMQVGASIAICAWIALTIYAKGWLAPRTGATRSHGMDERSVQLSFRCPQAIRA